MKGKLFDIMAGDAYILASLFKGKK